MMAQKHEATLRDTELRSYITWLFYIKQTANWKFVSKVKFNELSPIYFHTQKWRSEIWSARGRLTLDHRSWRWRPLKTEGKGIWKFIKKRWSGRRNVESRELFPKQSTKKKRDDTGRPPFICWPLNSSIKTCNGSLCVKKAGVWASLKVLTLYIQEKWWSNRFVINKTTSLYFLGSSSRACFLGRTRQEFADLLPVDLRVRLRVQPEKNESSCCT